MTTEDVVYRVREDYGNKPAKLYKIKVIKRTPKRIELESCRATSYAHYFTAKEVAEKFYTTPEAAIEAWQHSIDERINQLKISREVVT